MKNNRLKMTSILALFVAIFATSTAFTTTTTTTTPSSLETVVSDNTCTLYVSYSSGSPAKSIKVTTDVSGGISCIGGRSFYTDSDGAVTLKWVSGCYLKKVYVDGRGYEVDYKDGNSYYLTMK